MVPHRRLPVLALLAAAALVLATGVAIAADDADDPSAPDLPASVQLAPAGGDEEPVDFDDPAAAPVESVPDAAPAALDDGRAPDARPGTPSPAAPPPESLDDGRAPDAQPGPVSDAAPDPTPVDDGR